MAATGGGGGGGGGGDNEWTLQLDTCIQGGNKGHFEGNLLVRCNNGCQQYFLQSTYNSILKPLQRVQHVATNSMA